MLVYLYITHLFYATQYKLPGSSLAYIKGCRCCRTGLIPVYKHSTERGGKWE